MEREQEYPESPSDVIDPRWDEYLHSEAALSPAHHPDGAHRLGQEMAEIIEPWQRGHRGTRETLEALRQLANRAL